MNIQDHLETIRRSMATVGRAADAIEQLLPKDGVQVRIGDNLFSLVEQAPADTHFLLEPGFQQDGDVTWKKPVQVFGSRELGLPVLRGSHAFTADVEFTQVQFEGRTKEWAILTNRCTDGIGPTFMDCDAIGSVNGQHRGLDARGVGGLWDGGSITNIFANQDAQAVYLAPGSKGLRVRNARLESSGEVIMAGGEDPAREADIPRDWNVSKCFLTRPLAWRGRTDMTIKNLLEIKNSINGVFENNEAEYAWADGQVGFGLVLTVRNQDNTAPFSTIQGTRILNNTFRHMGSAIQIVGHDTNGRASGYMKDVLIEGNLFDDIDPVKWADGMRGLQVYISGGPENLQLVRNTFRGQNLNSAFYFEGRQADGSVLPRPSIGLVIQDHDAPEGLYGIKGDADASGEIVLTHYAPGYKWGAVTLHRKPGGQIFQYPDPGTTVVEDAP